MTLDTNRKPDLEGEVTLFPETESGLSKPATSGWRPAHKILDDYLTSGLQVFIGQDTLSQGQSCLANIWLITPDVYHNSIWPNKLIDLHSGSKKIGTVKVTNVYNKVLLQNG